MTSERREGSGSALSRAADYGGRHILDRRAARVLVVDERNRVLLMHGHDPAEPDVPYWFTVGGGIDEGESVRAAAVREVYEETGLVIAESDLIGPIWSEDTEFGFGEWWLRQSQEYFAVQVRAWDPIPAALCAIEIDTIIGWGWWTAAQLRDQARGVVHDGPGDLGEKVYPGAIVDLLENLPR